MHPDPNLKRFINDDLRSELLWLLSAATHWKGYKGLSQPERDKLPRHFDVHTMDSVFVHSRCLYEFFTMTEGAIRREDGASHNPASWRSFGAVRIESPFYTQWRESLHTKVVHMRTNRPDLATPKDEVMNFAKDILKLWDKFSTDTSLHPDCKPLLDAVRKEAVDVAAEIAEAPPYRMKPVFTHR